MLKDTADGVSCQDQSYVLARLDRFRLKLVSASFLPDSRVSICCRRVIPGSRPSVFLNSKINRAAWGGLMTCGSIWVCPVCAAKISERRRLEVKQAVTLHRSKGGYISLLTLTLPHYIHEPLSLVLDRLRRCVYNFKHRKFYFNFCRSINVIGDIIALEPTYGSNGWHPHLHCLIFHHLPIDYKDHSQLLLSSWKSAASSLGYPIPNKHGLDLSDGSIADAYISKWGLDYELTKSHIKRGSNGNLTPFDLLRDNKRKLFKEYAKVFFGKKQLIWSKGLKSRYLIADKTDEQIALDIEPDYSFLGSLTKYQWQLVNLKNYQTQVLQAAELGGWSAVLDLLQSLFVAPSAGKNAATAGIFSSITSGL